jgi:4-hydroxyphenylacetate 3-monooxygenase
MPTARACVTAALDLVFKDIGGVVTRVGDETVGEMWSLLDGRDVLAEIEQWPCQ